jgi:hypothetical protein
VVHERLLFIKFGCEDVHVGARFTCSLLTIHETALVDFAVFVELFQLHSLISFSNVIRVARMCSMEGTFEYAVAQALDTAGVHFYKDFKGTFPSLHHWGKMTLPERHKQLAKALQIGVKRTRSWSTATSRRKAVPILTTKTRTLRNSPRKITSNSRQSTTFRPSDLKPTTASPLMRTRSPTRESPPFLTREHPSCLVLLLYIDWFGPFVLLLHMFLCVPSVVWMVRDNEPSGVVIIVSLP